MINRAKKKQYIQILDFKKMKKQLYLAFYYCQALISILLMVLINLRKIRSFRVFNWQLQRKPKMAMICV